MQIKRYILTSILLLLVMLTTAADFSERPLCPSARHPRTLRQALHRVPSRQANSYVGYKRQLVLLVSFSDLTFQEENPVVLWDRIFNEKHFQEEPFYGSVHDYFSAQSYGKLDLEFDLIAVALDKEHGIYHSTTTSDDNSLTLLTDLLDVIKENVPDWAPYDWDDDGYVDQVLILFAGKGQNDGGDSSTIWAHQWSLSDAGRAPYPVTNSGRIFMVDRYGCFPELNGSGTYGTFGTLCHEYGHCLGLPDFYYGYSKFVYTWDIMDYGNYNMGGFCPPGYSAHERMLLGWLDVKELTEPVSVRNMGALADTQEAYLIRNDGYANEYYIVENRQRLSWDLSLPGSGIVVFHIDYDEKLWQKGFPNEDYAHYIIIPANNRTTISYAAGWTYPYGYLDSLTNLSRPAAALWHDNLDGTRLMSKPVTKMKVENGLASFDFMGGGEVVSINGPSSLPPLRDVTAVYSLQGRRIHTEWSMLPAGVYVIRYANGVTKKVVKP